MNNIFINIGTLPEAVLNVVKPVYRDLTNTRLLQKCLHVNIQNSTKISETASGK
jgi:hypothetical protein